MAHDDGSRLDFTVPDELLRTATGGSSPEDSSPDIAAVPGEAEGLPPPLRSILGTYGVTGLALMTLGNVLVRGVESGVAILGPDIQESFALSDAGLGAVMFTMAAAYFVSGLPLALAADRGRRTRVAAGALLVWGIAVPLLGLAWSAWVFAALLVVAGPGRAAPDSVHLAYLCDAYALEGRARVLAVHRAGIPLGHVVVGGAMGGIAAFSSWRWAMVVGLAAVPVGRALDRLREPAKGAQERQHVLKGGVAQDNGSNGVEPRVLLGTALQRVRRIRTLPFLYAAFAVLGAAAVGLRLVLNLYLERRWDLGSGDRAAVALGAGAAAFLGILAAGLAGDRVYRRDPGLPAVVGGGALTAFGVVYAVAVHLPALWMVVAGLVVAEGCLALAAVMVTVTVAATAPPAMRSLTFALVGIYSLVLGGFAGSVVLGAVSDGRGPAFALTLMGPFAVMSGGVLAAGASRVRGDIGRTIEDITEEAAEREQRSAGRAARAIQVHNVDFAYGTQQVLFDVELEIDEGEMCALLGTNGAGKSTLLRIVAGLEHASRGTVRLFGSNATYLEAEQVVALGVTMVPGGKMTFPSLTVEENLRAGAFAVAPARRTSGIDEVYERFPVLAERRRQAAGTLSGGEQQMLALGRALVHEPRLLLIDELTLGLAPKVVESLLDIVRAINADGTTVVLVEQSVNLALTLADRAVFLERGEVRFDGRTTDLVRRHDLLRPVFLGPQP